VAAGLDAATPAVAVERATRADERVIATTIAKLPARLAAEPPAGPIVVLIGRVFAEYLETALNEGISGRDAVQMRPAQRP
jgi:siroheme synthase